MKKSLFLLFCLALLASGRAVADVGDTLSYCGNSALQTRVGVNNTTTTIYWGIMLPASQLAGRDSVMSVLLYVATSDTGTYTVTLYQGGTTAPQTQLCSQTYYIGSSLAGGYVNCALTTPAAIISSQNLWVIVSNTDVLYPAAACAYVNDPNSNWLSTNGTSWSHASPDVGLNQSFSWLIKCVTKASANAAPTVIASGPTMAAVGQQLTFNAMASTGATVSWQLNGGNPSTATGNTATAVWNNPGTYNVIATATNANGTSRDTVVLSVVDCPEISSFPYTMGFESTDPVACWTVLDADGDGYTWDPSVFSSSEQAHTGSGCISSASYINGPGALEPDNWLISPQIYLPQGNGFSLSFYVGAVDQNYYAEHYGVYISTTGMSQNDFVLLQEYDVTTVNWVQKTINLDDYAGQHVYIAFRHFDIEDMYWMKIDDVTITMQQPSTYPVTFECEGNIVGTVTTSADSDNSLCGQQVSLSSEQTTNVYIKCQKFEYHLEALYVNGVDRMNDVHLNTGDVVDTYVFTFQPVEASTIRAVFQGRDIAINVAANPTQGGTVSGGGTYHYMDTIEIEAHANPGYVFAGWSDGDHSNPRQIIVTAATTYTANFQQTSGIANPGAQASAINVYPNPASDVVCIEIQNPDRAMRNYEVALIDLSGRTCQTAIAEGNSGSVDNIRLDISDLPQGSYFVRIQAEGVSLVRKFVKK